MAFRIGLVVLAAAPVCALAQLPGGNPLEPSGFPQNEAKDKRLPPPMGKEGAQYDFKLIKNKTFEIKDNDVSGTEMEFEYRGYRVRADEVAGNLETNQFSLRGNVNVLGQDEVIRGNTVFVDFRARTFRFVDGNADLKTTLMQGRLLSDLYLRAASVEGGENLIVAKNASVTTCDYDNPHYTFEASTLTAEPNRRLVFRDFKLRVLNKTIFSIPRFVIPLDRRRSDGIAPDIGNSPDEGYYAKTKIGLPFGGDTMLARIDAMSKRGLGLGADYDFQKAAQRGEFRAYSTFFNGQSNLDFTASGKYNADLKWGSFDLSHQMRQFSYLNGPNNTSNQTRLLFTPHQGGNALSQLAFTWDTNRSPMFGSSNSNLALTDSRAYSSRFHSNIQINFTNSQAESGGTTVSSRKVVDTRIKTSYDMGKITADLDYQRNIPVGSVLNFIGGIDRAPELSLRTDTRRWFGEHVPSWVPNFTALFSAGDYTDHFNNVNVARYFFDIHVNRPGAVKAPLSFSYDAGFKQGVYSDNSAQYTPSVNLLLSYKPSEKLSANIRYNYNHQFGFSPIQLDRTGQYNLASFDILFEALRGLTLGGQAGYDIDRATNGSIPWQSPSFRLEYKPNEWIRFRTLASYLPENNTWGNVRLDLTWKAGGTFVGVAARYDATRNVWGNVNLYVDAFKWGRLKLTTLLLYNGYLQRFDTRHLALTYDMHCAEAVLQILENNTGFRPGRQVLFFIRIKALPFSSPFGIGTLGQPLDIGTGFGG